MSVQKTARATIRESCGPRFTAECIHQVEQGVLGMAKAAVDPVTKFLDCVKVHGSNAPVFVFFWIHYSSLAIPSQELLRLF